MQSATSDVNAAIMKLREQLVISKTLTNTQQAKDSIYVMNEILPSKFRLIFNDEYYKNEISPVYAIMCACGTESEVSKQTVKYQPAIRGFGKWSLEFAKATIRKYISCAVCESKIYIRNDELILTKKSMFAAKYVPEEPIINSLYDSILNKNDFWHWVTVCHATLERQLRVFRDSFSTADGKAF